MATQTLVQDNYLALNGMVKRWDRWLRLRQTLLWLPRSFLPGLAIGLVLAVISRARPWLLPQQIALVTGALVVLGAALFALAVWLWRRSLLTSARRFDVQFRLNERVSTALELGKGTIHTNDELARRQIEDARAQASAIRVRDHIPLALRRRDWLAVIVMAAVLVVLLVLPNPQLDTLSALSTQQAAIDNAADTLAQTTQNVTSDSSLGNEQRKTLLTQLQTATNTLNQPKITPQEALAAVSDVQNSLKTDADNLNQQSQANQAALQQAAAALRQASQQSGDQSSDQQTQQLTQNLNQMAQDAQTMTDVQRQQAAQQLQQAAQALQTTNPQAAQNLNNAAQQLQQSAQQTQPQAQQAATQEANSANTPQQTPQVQSNSNSNSSQTQQQLQQAAQQVQQQQQQAQQQQQQAQTLNNAAQAAQQSAQQISQAQQQAQNANNATQQQTQPGQQPNNQPGQQDQSASLQSIQAGSQNPSQSQSSMTQPGQSQPGQSGQQNSGSLAAGNKPGDQKGDDSQGQQQTGDHTNQPSGSVTDQGEGQFEAVNVPKRIGPQPNDGNNIQLDPNASNSPVQEGDFTQNPNGQVTVPYDQVFSNYADAANHALDSDYVPLGLRDVVKDYFTSLEPKK